MKKSTLLGVFGNWCFYCNKELTEKTAEIDHLFPQPAFRKRYVSGHWNSMFNKVPSCSGCNRHKADSIPSHDEVVTALGNWDDIGLSPSDKIRPNYKKLKAMSDE